MFAVIRKKITLTLNKCSLHISELAEGTFLHPRNVVSKGQEVKARILRVDEKSRRLALSLRDVTMSDES